MDATNDRVHGVEIGKFCTDWGLGQKKSFDFENFGLFYACSIALSQVGKLCTIFAFALTPNLCRKLNCRWQKSAFLSYF